MTANAPSGPALSVNLMPTGPVGQVVELARQAEGLGYGRCWVYDEGLVTRDVYVTLAAVATATTTIGLGPGITNPYVRHPGATATAIASLDELSDGRAFLGLGAGGGLTLGPLAIDRRAPVVAVGETVAALRSLWSGESVTVEAPTFSFRDARLGYGRPDIEVLLAGRGPRMVRLGSQVADGFHLSWVHKSLLGSAVETLRRGVAERPRPFTIVYSTMVATTEADLDLARAQLSFRLVDSPPEVRALLGMEDHEVDAIRAALAESGPAGAARHVRPEWVDGFVVVGDATTAGAELRALLADNGIDEFQLAVSDLDHGAERIEAMAGLLLDR